MKNSCRFKMRIEKCQLIVRTLNQNSLCLHLVSSLDRPTSTRWCFITPLSFTTCYLWGSYQNIRRTVTTKCYNATIAKVSPQPQAILWLSRILTVSCKKNFGTHFSSVEMKSDRKKKKNAFTLQNLAFFFKMVSLKFESRLFLGVWFHVSTGVPAFFI